MEWVAHLGAQGVTGSKPTWQDTKISAGVEQGIPQGCAKLGWNNEFVAMLTGVARATHDDLGTDG